MNARARTGTLPVLFHCIRIVAIMLCVSTIAHAQFVVRSWLDWRTIETPHFAFHYPAELEAWTQQVAAHAESIDTAVAPPTS